MKNIHLIDSQYKGLRLDKFLKELYSDSSRSFLQKLIKDGCVLVNDNKKKANYILNLNDKIELEIPKPEVLKLEPENLNLDILYEDKYLLVVNKPKGMVVHPAKGNYTNTLVNGLLYHCEGSLSSINGVIRPGIVHRIDKDTTGLLMVAKDDFTHNNLSEQLKNRTIKRVYKMIVHGKFKEREAVIEAPISRSKDNRLKMSVDEDGKFARTNIKLLDDFSEHSFLEARLDTGRTHQIRVHLSYIGYPLLGDMVYGRSKNKFNLKEHVLHAETIGFMHPITNKYMEFQKELPDEFEKILKKLAQGND